MEKNIFNFEEKAPEWGWRDYYEYWRKLVKGRGLPAPSVSPENRGRLKEQVEYSLKIRGEEKFKRMIEYTVKHQKFLGIKYLDIGSICGEHDLANEVEHYVDEDIRKENLEDW